MKDKREPLAVWGMYDTVMEEVIERHEYYTYESFWGPCPLVIIPNYDELLPIKKD